MTTAPRIDPFTPPADPGQIDDLRARLRATRWPDVPDGAGWSLGTDAEYLRGLVTYWAEEFDWTADLAQQARLTRFSTTVGGRTVRFVHVRAAEGRGALPLLLAHGWPDSSWRYRKVVPLLTGPGAHGGDPADAFDVVVPDMPGFGWSPAPLDRVLSSIDVAALWAELMTALGYDRFGAAGGDIGSHVSRYLALDHPDRVVAVHRTDGGVPVWAGDPAELTPAEREWFAAAAAWGATEGGYAAMHRTRPQTAAFGLADSPVGLAAWIVEKLRAWSDCGGDVERSYTRDEILALVTEYWVTGTIGSSMRMYHANGAIDPAQLARRVEVPSGFALFPGDLLRPPRAWLERTTNLIRLSEPPRGGHFAAFEEPELYAAELREFFRPFRTAAR
ncbi:MULTISPECIES: epoxide hydrolase family protein [unclassified Isoptericola]|uniref:epoxide hydrolase family protein n=1 Tax=unclassified Isoptericola TaxID=2623355 RepID=UPI00364966AF